MTNSEYRDYIEGRSVVVVGPAPSVVGSGGGDLIDGHDVVVRLNHALPVPEDMAEDIGTRTDVLYSTLKRKSLLQNPQWLRTHLKAVVCPYGPVEPFDRYMRQCKADFLCPYDEFQYHVLESLLGVRPTIGFSAILHLMSLPLATLHVTGITFFRRTEGNDGGYHEQYKNKDDYEGRATEAEVMELVRRVGVHEPEVETGVMRRLVAEEDRVSWDGALEEVLWTNI